MFPACREHLESFVSFVLQLEVCGMVTSQSPTVTVSPEGMSEGQATLLLTKGNCCEGFRVFGCKRSEAALKTQCVYIRGIGVTLS